MKKYFKLLFAITLSSVVLSGCNTQHINHDSTPEPEPTPSPEPEPEPDPSPDYKDFPSFSEDGTALTYGYYPQTVVDDEELIASLNELKAPYSKGWYFHKGYYYVKLNAMPYGVNYYTFDNGEKIVKGQAYWFKCEQISWKVLSRSGKYLIVTEKLLDTCDFYSSSDNRTIGGKTIYPNNYEHSDLRAWLNESFYNSAFRFDDSYILTTNIDNSASTTYTPKNNPYYSNNTTDKVFTLSYQEYTNSEYGFDHDVYRRAMTTDWARARGAYANYSSITFKGCGYQWTRSPYYSVADYASYINTDGGMQPCAPVTHTDYGARPAIYITVS